MAYKVLEKSLNFLPNQSTSPSVQGNHICFISNSVMLFMSVFPFPLLFSSFHFAECPPVFSLTFITFFSPCPASFPPSSLCSLSHRLSSLLSLQSLDEDCTLEEEDEGLIQEEDEIDQFNDDTFGAGAIGE